MTELERYVTAGELAELMGVSERTIKRMVAAGMPSETWGMGRTRRFLPSQAIAWANGESARTSSSRIEVANQPARRANAVTGPNHQGV